MESELNRDEMPSDVSADWPIPDGMCTKCGCLGDCWQDKATTGNG